MLRTKRYKYCYNPADIDELYDLETDPHELKNLAEDCSMKPVLEDMKTRLYNEMVKHGENCVDTCGYGIGKNRRITGQSET